MEQTTAAHVAGAHAGSRELTVRESIVIDAAPRAVFDYACDYRNDSRWRSGVKSMDVRPWAVPADGTRTREVMRFMGRTIVTEGEIFGVEPGVRSNFRSLGAPIPVRVMRVVESIGDGAGSRLTYSLTAELSGFDAFLAPLMRAVFRRRVRGDLHRVKTIVETDAR